MTRDAKESDRVAQAIAEAARDGFALVSIDGPGGSGKSTLAADAAGRLGTDEVVVVEGDDFYRPMSPDQRLLLSLGMASACCSSRIYPAMLDPTDF